MLHARAFRQRGRIGEASKVRDSSPTIADAFQRIEQIRAAVLLQLRDDGLRDLSTPQGLKPAREKLAEALRIALPGGRWWPSCVSATWPRTRQLPPGAGIQRCHARWRARAADGGGPARRLPDGGR